MRFYHTTTSDGARSILSNGFRDREGYYLTKHLWKGVWLADRPLDCNSGADGDFLLEVHLDIDEVAKYEWIEEGKSYREFLIPAELINSHGKIRVAKENRWFNPELARQELLKKLPKGKR